MPSSQRAFTADDPYARAVRSLISHGDDRLGGASLEVHADDDMYNYGLDVIGSRDLATMAYFRAGLSVHDTATQLARWWFGDLDRISGWLDFAAGYGRSTRFLAEELGPDRVWIGEIQADAVDFQEATFGVHGLRSAADPDGLSCDRRFDVVFVASLFSHLPERTFARWLGRLYDLLSDDGVLIFSVHDESIRTADVEMPESGIAFVAASEVAELDTADYGVTFVTEPFVRRAVQAATGRVEVWRLPRALCFEQDVYVVGRRPAPAPPQLARQPMGSLDRAEMVDGRLLLQGWAADQDDDTCRVEAWLGETHLGSSTPGDPRPDVALHYHEPESPRLLHSGWTMHAGPPGSTDWRDALLVVKAIGRGRSFVLDCAPLRSSMARTQPASPVAPVSGNRLARKAATAVRLFRTEGLVAVLRQGLHRVRR